MYLFLVFAEYTPILLPILQWKHSLSICQEQSLAQWLRWCLYALFPDDLIVTSSRFLHLCPAAWKRNFDLASWLSSFQFEVLCISSNHYSSYSGAGAIRHVLYITMQKQTTGRGTAILLLGVTWWQSTTPVSTAVVFSLSCRARDRLVFNTPCNMDFLRRVFFTLPFKFDSALCI